MATRTLSAVVESLYSQGLLSDQSLSKLREALMLGEVKKSHILKLPGCADRTWISVLEACDLKQTITVRVEPKKSGERTSNYAFQPSKFVRPSIEPVRQLFAAAKV